MDVVARLLHILPAKKQHIHKESNDESKATNLIAEDGWSPPLLEMGHVRLVLFHDHDGRGKIPVFDTKQHYNQSRSKQNNIVPPTEITSNDNSLSSSFTHSHTSSLTSKSSKSSDSQLLGEMMFGSMPLKLAGNSVKIHYIRSQHQLILTKIFTAHYRSLPTCRVGDFSESCPLPVDNCYIDTSSPADCGGSSSRLRVPSVSPESDARLHSNSFNHSLLCPSPSPSASLPLSLASSFNHESASPNQSWTQGIPVPPSSLNSSLTRRLHRARSTSLENASHLYHRVLRPMDQGTTTVRKGRRYAVGLIFSLADMRPSERRFFQDFFFSHFTLISFHLEKLREKIEELLSGRRIHFPEKAAEAYNTFVNSVIALYCTRRIKAPVWLSVVRYSNDGKRDVCRKFLSEFAYLASQLENKDSRFFLSTVLTSVLSLHLAWMYTVSKNGHAASRHDKMASKSLAVLPETHPYNPLWAQLGDLYGAVTDPLIITRTIVTGTNAPLIHRLLYVLTYFIRCSEIEPNSAVEFKRGSIFEESDKQHESRAGSTITVTDDIISQTSNSIKVSQSSVDLPLIKPHPFSFGLNSVSNSLRSLNDTDSVTDPPTTPGSVSSSSRCCFDNVNTSISSQYKRDDHSCPPRARHKGVVSADHTQSNAPERTHHSPCHAFSPSDSHNFSSYGKPKCTCSVDSNDSCVSEPATDSGQFSDADVCQRTNRESLIHSNHPPTTAYTHDSLTNPPTNYRYYGGSLPTTSLGNTVSSVASHDKLHCLSQANPSFHQHVIPGINITSSFDSNNVVRCNSSSNFMSTTHTSTARHNPSSALVISSPLNHCSSTPNMRNSSTDTLLTTSGTPLVHNKSWTGLPLLEGACTELSDSVCQIDSDNCHEESQEEDEPMQLKIDQVDVEQSLSPMCVRMISSSPSASLLSDDIVPRGMKYAQQFRDFTPIDISRCTVPSPQVKHHHSDSDPPHTATTSGRHVSKPATLDKSLSDFGHSLMAGYSDTYLTDFVLHGTSQPLSAFKDAMISDLSSIVKNSIVDLPVQHAAAIVVDADSLSCKLFVVSKSSRTIDGELLSGCLPSSHTVHEMIQSVTLLWRMQMAPEFCLSHLEDRLMELNDRSQILSGAILEKSDSLELPSHLQRLHSSLNILPSDQQLLQTLASVHCSDCDRSISSALQTSFIHSLTNNSKSH